MKPARTFCTAESIMASASVEAAPDRRSLAFKSSIDKNNGSTSSGEGKIVPSLNVGMV